MIIKILGILAIIFGVFNAWKYLIQSNKIKEIGNSYQISRRFLLISLTADLFAMLYAILRKDIVFFCIFFLNSLTVLHGFWIAFTHYPRIRGRKKDNVWIFTLDGLHLLSRKQKNRYGYRMKEPK